MKMIRNNDFLKGALRTTAACALFSAVLAGGADAAGTSKASSYVDEIKLGALYHDVDGLWSGTRRESGADFNLELIFAPSIDFQSGKIRPALGGTFNTSGGTSKAYLDARWEYESELGVFFALGIGGAYHNGETKLVSNDSKALGSQFLFHFPIELGYRHDGTHSVSLFFDHVSNAWLADPNEGMDTLGLRYGYKF